MTVIDHETPVRTSPTSRRTLIALGAGTSAAFAVLAAAAIGLGIQTSGEDARTAENACRAATLGATGGGVAFDDPLQVRSLSDVDSTAEQEVAQLVVTYSQTADLSVSGRAPFVVTGQLDSSIGSYPFTCLVVLTDGKVTTTPLISTGVTTGG